MSDSNDLRVVFLGSGSGGNAVAVTDGDTTVLIDCGFSAREVARRMGLAGLDAGSVDAILLTHEHSDHLRGVEVFARRHGCEVLATTGTRRAAGLDAMDTCVVGIAAGSEARAQTRSKIPVAPPPFPPPRGASPTTAPPPGGPPGADWRATTT